MEIVCLSPIRWNALWQRHQQLMIRLAEEDRVLFVEPADNALRRLWRGDDPGTVSEGGGTPGTDNLVVYVPPPSLPLRSSCRAINRAAYAALGARVDREARRLGFRDPVLWVTYPNAVDAAARIRHRLLCFDCADKHSSNARAIGKRNLDRMQVELYRTADLVLAISLPLFREAREQNEHVFLVPDAGDPEACDRAGAHGPPEDLRRIRRPIVGFVGAICEWVDLDLVAYLAVRHPEWSMVLVGPRMVPHREMTRLRGLDNVHFLGRRPYETVHRYIRAFDVCMLPFKMNRHIWYSDPIVTYDYLCVGKPIVSVDFPQVRGMRRAVAVAEDPDAFVRAVERCLNGEDEDLRCLRQEMGRVHSWDARVREVRRILRGM